MPLLSQWIKATKSERILPHPDIGNLNHAEGVHNIKAQALYIIKTKF
ncbi:MAG: hypothetical protein IKC48_00585 [Clostridia bacterium]|nr:hypothetical protein [Clostridia bacterium]